MEYTYLSILRRLVSLNSGMSDADGGRNISVNEGAVCGLGIKFWGRLRVLKLLLDVEDFSLAISILIGIKLVGVYR